MKGLDNLNEMLFKALESVNRDDATEEEIELAIRRSEATSKIADKIIDTAKVQLDAWKYMTDLGIDAKAPKALLAESNE